MTESLSGKDESISAAAEQDTACRRMGKKAVSRHQGGVERGDALLPINIFGVRNPIRSDGDAKRSERSYILYMTKMCIYA